MTRQILDGRYRAARELARRSWNVAFVALLLVPQELGSLSLEMREASGDR